jgi:LmbE family N-acetylglucosaminyl deacetylase
MHILAVGAHPDDLEILCGGTLARYAKAGHQVTMAVATNGEVGSPTLSREEISEIRRREAFTSAAVIGADFVWMNYPDEFLFSNEESRRSFLNMVRKARPDVILTHAPADYHPDHRTTGQIIWDIRIMTTVPNIETEEPPCVKIPEIYYFDTIAGIDFVPQYYVDISETFELKKQMLACHKSQSTWLEDQYQMDYMQFIDTISRYRGLQCGAKYAECFQVSPTWPKGSKPPLLP